MRANPAKNSVARTGSVSRSTLVAIVLLAFLAGAYTGSLVTRHWGQRAASSGPAGETAAEIRRLEQLTRKEPRNLAAWITLGTSHYDAHQHEKSIAAYERALSIDPDNPDVLTDLGVMYLSVDQASRAVASFDKALALRPGHQIALLNRGFAFLEMGRKDEARASWLALLRLNPKAELRDGTPVSKLVGELEK
jgi:cytochrome c-type biogenesis protein CcmH/NrfG